jgi:hypothetical protein
MSNIKNIYVTHRECIIEDNLGTRRCIDTIERNNCFETCKRRYGDLMVFETIEYSNKCIILEVE